MSACSATALGPCCAATGALPPITCDALASPGEAYQKENGYALNAASAAEVIPKSLINILQPSHRPDVIITKDNI